MINEKGKVFTADIYSTPEEFQTVFFQMGYEAGRGVDDFLVRVTELKINIPLLIEPSDLRADMEVAIANLIGVDESEVVITCEIEYTKSETVNTVTI